MHGAKMRGRMSEMKQRMKLACVSEDVCVPHIGVR